MKWRFLFPLLLSWLHLPAQTPFQQDLLLLRKTLEQETMSFKGQIRGEKAREWNGRFETIYQDSSLIIREAQFLAMASLIAYLNDGHLGLYQLPDSAGQNPTPLMGSLKGWRKGSGLEDTVAQYYTFAGSATIQVVQRNPNLSEGIVLEPGKWPLKKNQLVAQWFWDGNAPACKAAYFNPATQTWVYHAAERWTPQGILYSQLYGLPANTLIRQKGLPAPVQPLWSKDYSAAKLNQDWWLLCLPHFNGFNKARRQAAADFADSVAPLINTPNLLIDLRGNTGGSDQASNPFLRLAQRFAEAGGKLHVLIDAYTLSRGELFTLQLKKISGVRVYGQTSKGMLAYGSNTGKRLLLPQSRTVFYPTDLWSGMEALRLEGVGIVPDRVLPPGTDWLQEVVNQQP